MYCKDPQIKSSGNIHTSGVVNEGQIRVSDAKISSVRFLACARWCSAYTVKYLLHTPNFCADRSLIVQFWDKTMTLLNVIGELGLCPKCRRILLRLINSTRIHKMRSPLLATGGVVSLVMLTGNKNFSKKLTQFLFVKCPNMVLTDRILPSSSNLRTHKLDCNLYILSTDSIFLREMSRKYNG